jgi:hypothetical protein
MLFPHQISLYKIETFCNLLCLLQLSNALFSSLSVWVYYKGKQETPIDNAQVKFYRVIYSGM